MYLPFISMYFFLLVIDIHRDFIENNDRETKTSILVGRIYVK